MYASLTLSLTVDQCLTCLMTLGNGANNSLSVGYGRKLTQEENPTS